MVFFIYCNICSPKIIKPIYLSSYGSMNNCSAIAMVTKNTSMYKRIKGTKTPIMYLIGNCHFNWLIIYIIHSNMTYWLGNAF